MTSLSRSLRARIQELNLTGVDTTDMARAADQLQSIEDKERAAHQGEAILHAVNELRDALWQSRQRDDQRQDALHHDIHQLMEKIIMLDKDVQAAVDQIALNTSAEASATAALTLLVTQVADLQAAIAAIPPNVPVNAENLAAIKAMTDSLKGTLGALTTAIPANVTPPGNGGFVPDPALVQAAADALAASDAAAAAAAASPNDPVLAQAATDAKAKSDAAALAAADPNAGAAARHRR